MLTTGNQLKAARALAGIEQTELAQRAELHVNTIRSMEAAGSGPIAGRAVNVRAVQVVLEAAGVEFTNGGEPGVKLRGRIKNWKPKMDPEILHLVVERFRQGNQIMPIHTASGLPRELGRLAWVSPNRLELRLDDDAGRVLGSITVHDSELVIEPPLPASVTMPASGYPDDGVLKAWGAACWTRLTNSPPLPEIRATRDS